MSYIGNGVGRSQIVAGQIGNGAVTYPTLDTSVTVPLTGYKNKIINGNFDIWQRGGSLASGTGNRYLADRWANNSGGSTITASQQAFTLGQTAVPGEPVVFHRSVVATSAGAANYATLQQRIESVRTLAGQTLTISFWAKADASKSIAIEFSQNFGTGGSPSVAVNAIGAQKFNLTTTWQKFQATVAIPSVTGKTLGTNNNDNLELTFWFDAGSNWNTSSATLGQQSGTFDIAQVQVEAGTYATQFEFRPMSIEILMCQRYCFAMVPGSGQLYTTFGSGQAVSTTGFYVPITFPASMRSAPVLTTSTLSTLAATNSTGSGQAVTALSVNTWGYTGVLLSGSVASGLTAGNATLLTANNNGSAFLLFNADL